MPTSATDTVVTATRFVLDGWPIHIVVHDRQGRWRVMGAQTFRPVDDRLTRWNRLILLDPSLVAVPPLARGTLAHRSTVRGRWHVVAG